MESDFALLRVNVDGTADNSFGIGGWVTTGQPSTWEHAFGLAQQNNGRILAAGTTATGGPFWDGETVSLLLARYEGLEEPAAEIDRLKDGVASLVDGSALNPGQGHSLGVKLDIALAILESGQSGVAANLLQSFVNQLEDLVATGELTAAEAQPLIDWARVIVAAIENP
jgi:hypothetical protein